MSQWPTAVRCFSTTTTTATTKHGRPRTRRLVVVRVCVCVWWRWPFSAASRKNETSPLLKTCETPAETVVKLAENGVVDVERGKMKGLEEPRSTRLAGVFGRFSFFSFFLGGGGSFLPDTKLGNPLGDLASSRRRPLVDAGSQWPTSTLLIDLLTHRRFRRQITLGFRFFFGLG